MSDTWGKTPPRYTVVSPPDTKIGTGGKLTDAAAKIERLRNALIDIANMPVIHEGEKIFGEIARAALNPKE